MKFTLLIPVHLFILLGLFFTVPVASVSQNGLAEFTEHEYTEILPPTFQLSKKLKETSGLIYFDDGFWTFNDSGGKPELYKIRTSDGVIERTVVIENGRNVDYEDITQDDEYIYIGDFGNNWGTRKNLTIYKLRKKSLMTGQKVTINPEIIIFSYNDQKSFNMNNRNHNFDCEAMVSFGDQLILFTKNWTNGNTRMYKLPKKAGNYKLETIAMFEAKGLVTGADYNEKTNQLAILGYTDRVPFIYLFYGFDGNDFNTFIYHRVNFPQMLNVQTEGICFVDEETLAISAEKTDDFKQAVYTIQTMEMLGKVGKKKE